MMKKKLVVDWRNSGERMVYQQLSSYFCIKTKSKEKLYPFLFQLARLTANVILCTCIYFNRSVGMMWLCEDITTITIIIIYLFFPSLSLVSTASLRFFLCSSSTSLLQSNDVSWTYIHSYRWKMCSFCAPICHSGIHVMYSSEEIMFLCVQSNHFSSLSLIIRYA